MEATFDADLLSYTQWQFPVVTAKVTRKRRPKIYARHTYARAQAIAVRKEQRIHIYDKGEYNKAEHTAEKIE